MYRMISRCHTSHYFRRDLCRQRIGWVGVEVWTQFMRGYSVVKKVRYGQNSVRWWHFDLYRIQPAPDMHLSDPGARNALTNTTGQVHLAPSELDRFRERFF